MYKVPHIPVPPMIPLEELKAEQNTPKQNNENIVLWTIHEIAGPHGNLQFLCDRRAIFGRSTANCNVVFPHNEPGISKVHCEVVPTAEGILLKDLNSTYGTYLGDGTRLEGTRPVLLQRGDTFFLASEKVMFQVQ